MILGVLGCGNAFWNKKIFFSGKVRVYIYHNTCLISVVSLVVETELYGRGDACKTRSYEVCVPVMHTLNENEHQNLRFNALIPLL